jgi:hypothetical protein
LECVASTLDTGSVALAAVSLAMCGTEVVSDAHARKLNNTENKKLNINLLIIEITIENSLVLLKSAAKVLNLFLVFGIIYTPLNPLDDLLIKDSKLFNILK